MGNGPTQEKRAKLSREEVAAIEVGRTAITPGQRNVLVFAFLFVIFAVPLVQTVHESRLRRAGLRPSALPQSLDIMPRALAAARIVTRRTAPQELQRADLKPAVLRQDGLVSRIFKANSVMLRYMKEYEDDQKNGALLAESLLPHAQLLLARLGGGNEEAYPGRDGWLFYRPAMDYLTGAGFLTPGRLLARRRSGSEWRAPPQPDPVFAILHFGKRLADRGIRLVVVPAPIKAQIHPERFCARYEQYRGAVENPSFAQFVRELSEPEVFFEGRFRDYAEVVRNPSFSWYRPFLEELLSARDSLKNSPPLVCDPAPALLEARSQGQTLYLESDTHWTPRGMALAAEGLARLVHGRMQLAVTPRAEYVRRPVRVSNLGDIATMLKLPPEQQLYRKQTVEVQQVLVNNLQWRPSRDADVLVLGDSFANVYSLGAMGWGEAAGLPEQLSFELKRPVDAIIRNDAGAFATREMLAEELARGRDRLEGKKVVVWVFSARELAVGDWKLIDLRLGRKRESAFYAPPQGTTVTVTGTVQAVSAVPRPGTVTYKDHVCTVHLVDLTFDDQSGPADAQALVRMYSMKDNVWTAAPRYRPGEKITLRLSAWPDEEDPRAKLNRSSLDELLIEDHAWGEPVAAGPTAPGLTPASVAPGAPELGALAGLALVVLLTVWACSKREERLKKQESESS